MVFTCVALVKDVLFQKFDEKYELKPKFNPKMAHLVLKHYLKSSTVQCNYMFEWTCRFKKKHHNSIPQSRQSARHSLQSSELASVAPPLWFKGGDTLAYG